MKNMNANFFGFLVILVFAVAIGVEQMFQPELDARGHLVLMALVITVGLWIFKPLNIPASVSGGLFMASLLALGVPAANVFSGFSSGAVWALIPALFFGFALAKTGLGKRIAYFGLKSIRVTYPNLLIMWMLIGIVLSMLTPSITVRVIIVIPIALNCVQVCKLKEGSKERSLILISAWAMAVIPGIGWLSGSLAGPLLSGFYASVPGLAPIDFFSWVKVSLFPVAIITIFTVLISYFVFKPSGKLNIGKEVFQEEYEKLGPMSNPEKITAIVLTACFLMFTTNSLHHIADAAVCLVGMFALTAAGIIESKDISSGISWDLVLFIGAAMGFGSVFAVTGISAWLAGILVETIAPVAWNPWLFVFTALFVMFVWRFVDVAVYTPTMAIISAILPEVFIRYNINPLVWVPLLCIAMNSFFLSYTNMFSLVAQANMGNGGWTSGHFTKYGIVYFVVSMLAMLAAVPYWIAIGMF